MAEQSEPVKRRVALKIIKLGMDTKQVVARFEAERQALAMMDHPNIAKVLDAGSTDTGRPFFVMELVKGVPILDYCDTAKLDTKARLDLFTKVCNAIQHAHQKGIIHRDIKPSNVMVTLHDGVPVPKVIDFGIAKATNSELTSKTLFTEHRQMIGTPAYMSPEQAEMSGLDIDTRSDIYSLGVLLYELLTGTTPFDTKSLMEAGFAEMMRIIREDEPHKPSTRLSTLGATATRTAEQRRTEAGKLSSSLRGDLDWIVMKCIEKDRTRRYETANGLAADIRRHLDDEPVEAGPPSTAYRVRKFIRRNRIGVTAAGIVAAAVVLGAIGTTGGMIWAMNERERADQNAAEALAASRAEAEARAEADANAALARREAERVARELMRVSESKRFITDMLGSVSPEVAQGLDTALMREILDGAAVRLAAGEIDDELIEAELRATVGMTYRLLGEYDSAEPHVVAALETRRRLLGDDHPDTIDAVSAMGRLRRNQGRLPESLPHFRDTLERRRRLLPPDDPATLESMNDLGVALWELRRLDEARPYFEAVLEARRRTQGDEHPDTITAIGNMAVMLDLVGELDEAERLCREALAGYRRVLGADHPSTLTSRGNLAELLRTRGALAEAESECRAVLDARRRILGDEHPGTLYAQHALATMLMEQGRLDEAEPLVRSTLEARRRVLGPEHPNTLLSMNAAGAWLVAKGRHAEAALVLRASLDIGTRLHSRHFLWVPQARSLLGAALTGLERYDEAEPLLLQAFKDLDETLPAGRRHRHLPPAAERIVAHYDARHRRNAWGGYAADARSWRERLEELAAAQ